jgi:hypothetical protein
MDYRKEKRKDHLIIGVLIGAAIPFVSYAILMVLVETLQDSGVIRLDTFEGRFNRTLGLIALCFNIIPMNIFKKRYQLNSMRGIILSTLAWAIVWLWYFDFLPF